MKPCPQCAAPMENAAEKCPKCGATARASVGLRPLSEGTTRGREEPLNGGAWLRGELKTALTFVGGNALTGFLFMAAGGLVGYLVYGTDGLMVGAAIGFVIKILS